MSLVVSVDVKHHVYWLKQNKQTNKQTNNNNNNNNNNDDKTPPYKQQ